MRTLRFGTRWASLAGLVGGLAVVMTGCGDNSVTQKPDASAKLDIPMPADIVFPDLNLSMPDVQGDIPIGSDFPSVDFALKDDAPHSDALSNPDLPLPTGCTVLLVPQADPQSTNDAVQTALVNAAPGDVICFAAGTYLLTTELGLATPNVELRGPDVGDAILDESNHVGAASGSNCINVMADHFKMARLTLKNCPVDGVRVTAANGVHFDSVTVESDAQASTSNGAYGLYPVSSNNVLIENCKVSGASDAGIYIGQSTNILVRNNEVFGNVAGIEIENSTDAEVVDNNVHENVGGILVFNLPNLMVEDGKRAKVHHNTVVNNNTMNFASMASIVSQVPSGTGIMVMASDNNEIHENTVTDNDSAGFVVVSYLLLMRAFTDDMYDAYPETNYIHDNTFNNNGTAPHDLAAALAALAHVTKVEDMIWDGIVDDMKDNSMGQLKNCFNNNGAATYRNLDAGGNPAFGNTSTDIGPATCVWPSLPAITPTP